MLFSLLGSRNSFQEILVYLLLFIPIYLISFSVHEAAHAFTAWKLGDPTARNLGRLTLNPMKHLDPIGTIAMLVIGIGYGKPVPINSRYFKKPKRDMAISSAAGPLSNLLLAFIGMVGYTITNQLTPFVGKGLRTWPFTYYASLDGFPTSTMVGMILMTFFFYFGWMNVSLAIFNLIPIPPFDGSRIAFAILPDRYYWKVMQYERYIMIGLIAVIFGLNRVLPVSPIALIAEKILSGIYFLANFLTKWIALL